MNSKPIKKIKMITLDLDGTTLDSKGKLPEMTREALARAMRAGVHVVIATGRVFSALPHEVLAIEGIEYAITSNGACVTRLSDMKVLHTSNLDPNAVVIIEAILRTKPFMVEVFTGGKAYIERKIYEDIENYGLSEKHTNYIKTTRIPYNDVLGLLLEKKDKIENININFASQIDRMAMRKEMEELGVATVTTSFDHNIELGGLSTSKANGIRALGEILGVSLAETMGCGDSPNDIEMLRAVGLSIAVGNAKDEVKAVCDHIVSTNDECGVAEAIGRFVL